MLVDAHMHLGAPNSAPNIIYLAKENQTILLSSSVNLNEAKEQLAFASDNLKIFVGLHPWFVDSSNFDETLFSSLLSDPRVVGIGECGLDANCSVPFDKQNEIFLSQLSFALKFNKPLCIHSYKTNNEIICHLKKFKGKLRGIIHGFTSSYEIAKQYVDLGFYISLSHHILKKTDKHISLVNKLGLNNIVLETDYESSKADSYDFDIIKSYYQALSDITNVKYESVQNILLNNINSILENSK